MVSLKVSCHSDRSNYLMGPTHFVILSSATIHGSLFGQSHIDVTVEVNLCFLMMPSLGRCPTPFGFDSSGHHSFLLNDW